MITILTGNVLDTLPTLPSNSVQAAFALRRPIGDSGAIYRTATQTRALS
jgi:hypothetical protein